MSSITLDKPAVTSSRISVPWQSYRSVLALMAILFLLSFLTEGTFFTPRNLTNLTRQVSINGILAIGMTFVILIGGIDLSVGSVVALSGVVAGLLQVNLGLSQWSGGQGWIATTASVFVAVGVGIICGMFNGWFIVRHKIAPFIITLGMMVIARGLALILAKGAAIAPLSDQFNFIGQGYLSTALSVFLIGFAGLGIMFFSLAQKDRGLSHYLTAATSAVLTSLAIWIFYSYRGLPVPVVIFGILGICGVLLLQKTCLGRFILAIGGNPEAAWLAGVPLKRISFEIYVLLGAFAGLCGAILSARLNGALPTAGELFELDAVAAVVIGGTSLKGGIGTVKGSILGAFFMGALNNGMSLLDVNEFYQKVIKGMIIILAVWFDQRSHSK